MLNLQALIRFLILLLCAAPILGALDHEAKNSTTNVLAGAELGSNIDKSPTGFESGLQGYPVENDTSDAFQESFKDGVIVFDDDHRNYVESIVARPAKVEPAEPATAEKAGIERSNAQPARENEPTLNGFAAEVRGPALFAQICRSREFQPTLENWWISGANQWLKDFTAANKNTVSFKAVGLVGAIVQRYLDGQDFRCVIDLKGGFRPGTCRIDCLDIVGRVNDIEEARRVFFVLAGVSGLATRIGTIYNAVGEVPRGITQLVEEMPTRAGFSTQDDALSDILFNSINSALFAASPWLPIDGIRKAGYEALQVAKHHYDIAIQVSSLARKGTDPFKWDKAFDSTYGMSLAEIDFAPKGYTVSTAPVPEGMIGDTWYSKAVLRTRRALEDARAYVVEMESGNVVQARNEGFELFKGFFAYSSENPNGIEPRDSENGVEGVLRRATRKARVILADALSGLLRGDGFSEDGTTELSILLRYGHYLPSGPNESISEFKNSNIGQIITRNVFMELFDISIRQEYVYISCTEDKQQRVDPRTDLSGAQTESCKRDNTGPQDLKACFGNLVCYLYEWKERPMSHMSRNRAPKGVENWDEKPWSIDVQDIILSSVATHFQKDLVPTDTAEEADLSYKSTTLDTLRNARSAYHFTIPVCISQHNWNTRLDGWNTFCDTSGHCMAKNLPCQCGPSGRDTKALWEDIGLWNSSEQDFYSAKLCPRQIQKKIADPLERYVTYCNLGIKRRGIGGSRVDGVRRYQGRDKYCDVITKTVQMQKSGLVGELDPETRFMFLCQIQNGGRGCGMYQETFDRLWESTREGTGEVTLVGS